jgi:bacteriocin biosynthesis cyclodehydratase domain-containing protein
MEEMQPRLRAGILLLRRTGDATYTTSPDITRSYRLDDPDGSWHALLSLADGTRSVAEIAAAMAVRGLPRSEADVREAVADGVAAGLLVDASGETSDAAHDALGLYLESVVPTPGARGDRLRSRLRDAHVVVLGAGGIGSWVALSLAMSGVGAIVAVDPDVVEARNLTRQPYPQRMVGRRKIEALGRLLRERAPATRVTGVDLRIDGPDDLGALLDGATCLVCCADEPDPGAMGTTVAQACVPRGVPHVAASYAGTVVRAGPFWMPPVRGRHFPCPGCLASESRRAAARPDDVDPALVAARRAAGATWPTSVVQAQIAASLAVSDVLLVAAGRTPAMRGRTLVFDPARARLVARRIRFDAECPGCMMHLVNGSGRRPVAGRPSNVVEGGAR